MTSRLILPKRRRSFTITLDDHHVTFGAAGGGIREVFISGPKIGSQMDILLDEISVLISLALQHNIPAAALAKSIARQGKEGQPTTIVGKVLDMLTKMEETRFPE